MRSMTGYGHYLYTDDKYDIEVEIKSVNSRYLDININTDSIISHMDGLIREKVSANIKRGRVSVRVYVTDKQELDMELNTVYLKRLFELHQQAQEIIGTDETISVQDFLQYDGVLIRRISKISDDSFTEALSCALDNCLKEHEKMTLVEGENMRIWIVSSIKRIIDAISKIDAHIPYYHKELKNKLTKSVEELVTVPLGEDIEKRLMAEISLYMDKADVTEELVRLNAHINKVELFLENEVSETGRKLNFIFQEMHREIQTIGSKFNGVRVFPYILLIKEEIEKCRELVQNVE